MMTECNRESFRFHALGRRDVVARFDGGRISSDAGGLLLRETERITGIIGQFAGCFTDHRNPDLIEHTVEELVAQRVYALALGYEDLNDHDDLRHDPLLAVLVGKKDPLGRTRGRRRDRGKALAGKSTLNRLELTPVRADAKSRYKKIALDRQAVQRLFTDVFIQSHKRPPKRMVLDLDATDDPIHGHQSGRFFHGYYKNYCYLPLYIFCGEHLLCARMRPSSIDASAGSVKELDRIVGRIREWWPHVEIAIRGDAGVCREAIMAWCEANNIDFVLGLAKNERLIQEIESELAQAKCQFDATQQPARVFKDFRYRTQTSWSRSRRVIGKAEHLAKGANPRFVVTSLSAETFDARSLYEKEYCARGEMENRIKEQQLCLFADRTSAATMRANELRLWFSSVAYTLMNALRRLGLKDTSMARARCDTIRLKLLKIGAQVRVTLRKVWVSMSESCPYRHIFRQVYDHLVRLRPIRLRC
ncbi:MAG: IS1380 family transposase [Gemmatimonadales bacterium]